MDRKVLLQCLVPGDRDTVLGYQRILLFLSMGYFLDTSCIACPVCFGHGYLQENKNWHFSSSHLSTCSAFVLLLLSLLGVQLFQTTHRKTAQLDASHREKGYVSN